MSFEVSKTDVRSTTKSGRAPLRTKKYIIQHIEQTPGLDIADVVSGLTSPIHSRISRDSVKVAYLQRTPSLDKTTQKLVGITRCCQVYYMLKTFPCGTKTLIRKLENTVNEWISNQRCWLEILEVSFDYLAGEPLLLIEYTTGDYGPRFPTRTRSKVLLGMPEMLEQYLDLARSNSQGLLNSNIIDCQEFPGIEEEGLSLMVLVYRSRVAKVELGTSFHGATHRLNKWLKEVPATQCPDSVIALSRGPELTIHVGTSLFVPQKKFAFCGSVLEVNENDSREWETPALYLPRNVNPQLMKFPARIVSNVATIPLLGDFRVVIMRFEEPKVY